MAVFKLLEKINNFSKVSIKIKFKSFAFKFIVSILLGFKIKPFARNSFGNLVAAIIAATYPLIYLQLLCLRTIFVNFWYIFSWQWTDCKIVKKNFFIILLCEASRCLKLLFQAHNTRLWLISFFNFIHFLDCVQKALNTSGGGGRYSCDECGKLFKVMMMIMIMMMMMMSAGSWLSIE